MMNKYAMIFGILLLAGTSFAGTPIYDTVLRSLNANAQCSIGLYQELISYAETYCDPYPPYLSVYYNSLDDEGSVLMDLAMAGNDCCVEMGDHGCDVWDRACLNDARAAFRAEVRTNANPLFRDSMLAHRAAVFYSLLDSCTDRTTINTDYATAYSNYHSCLPSMV